MDLLEREKDMAVLAGALADAVAGRGRIALVSGEAGIGKSAFVEHFIADARQGAVRAEGPLRSAVHADAARARSTTSPARPAPIC